MNTMNILELIKEYHLTLRCFPEYRTTTHRYTEKEAQELTQKGIDFIVVEGVVKDGVKPEQYKFYERESTRYKDGFVIEKFIRYQKISPFHAKNGVWGCKMDEGLFGWSEKTDFFAKTPEKAVQKAVAAIEKRKKEIEELHKQAGIN